MIRKGLKIVAVCLISTVVSVSGGGGGAPASGVVGGVNTPGPTGSTPDVPPTIRTGLCGERHDIG